MRHNVALRRTVAVAVYLGLSTAGLGCQGGDGRPAADSVAPTVAVPVVDRLPTTRPTVVAVVSPARVVTPQDVLTWSGRGLSDDAILDRLDGAVCPTRVTTADEVHLHDAGVSHDVIRALCAAGTN